MPVFDHKDTIAAISTPPGVGGISVIRLSGEKARDISLLGLEIDNLEPRYAHFTKVVDADKQEIIDDVVVIWFKAPASYTGDDTVEISCHGGYAAAPAILELYFRLGARPALPGEFTRRAFLNGKIDLLQAEAVADLIHAVSDSGKKLATRTLEGRLSEKVAMLRHELTDIASILELELDFVEQEINTLDHYEVLVKIQKAKDHLLALHHSYSGGKILREGALVTIAGRPNAGKSSVLNALLAEERAIISHIPGTTRDTIEELFVHDGVVFRLVDTAGLRDTVDPVEKIGADRARASLFDSDLILLVIDPSENNLSFEKEFLLKYNNKDIIVVYNKSDLGMNVQPIACEHSVSISALKRTGILDLAELMAKIIKENHQLGGETIAITRQRHKLALQNSLSALERTEEALQNNLSNEFLAIDIREAISALDDITGLTTSQDVLNHIFDQFCIGK